mgnify:CR=1 FL=1
MRREGGKEENETGRTEQIIDLILVQLALLVSFSGVTLHSEMNPKAKDSVAIISLFILNKFK